MADPFNSYMSGLESPGEDGFTITPADEDLAVYPRALWIGGAGSLVVETIRGTVLTFTVGDGVLLPLRCKQVRAATDATNIIGLI